MRKEAVVNASVGLLVREGGGLRGEKKSCLVSTFPQRLKDHPSQMEGAFMNVFRGQGIGKELLTNKKAGADSGPVEAPRESTQNDPVEKKKTKEEVSEKGGGGCQQSHISLKKEIPSADAL